MRLTTSEALALCGPGEEPWEGFSEGTVIFQKECPDPDCHKGLLLAPARFHSKCEGSGFVTRVVRLND